MPAPKWALPNATASVEMNTKPTNHQCPELKYMPNISYILDTSTMATPYTLTMLHKIKHNSLSNHEESILVLDTLQWHQYCSSSHHTQCPTHCSYRSPLSPHLECYHLLVAADQLCMELQCKCNCITDPFCISITRKNIPSHPTPASAE